MDWINDPVAFSAADRRCLMQQIMLGMPLQVAQEHLTPLTVRACQAQALARARAQTIYLRTPFMYSVP